MGTRCGGAVDARNVPRCARGWRQLRGLIVFTGLVVAGCEPLAHDPTRMLLDGSISVDAARQMARGDAAAPPWLDSAAPGEAGQSPVRAQEGALPWLRSEVALEPDGRSAPLRFALGTLTRPVFALRTYAADAAVSAGLCFQLEEVRADAQAWWVPRATSADYGDYCTRCEQRVAVGSGYGMFVLPSAAAPPQSVGSLELRIALRDCLTLSPLTAATPKPSSLVVESVGFSAPPRRATLALPLLIVLATPDAFSGGALLADVFAQLRETWRAAGIELSLRGPLALPRPAAPVVYGATDRQALSALAHDIAPRAREAGVEATAAWLVLTPCLVRRDASVHGISEPLAISTHLPGGFAVADEPGGMFVAGERCGGLTPFARYADSGSLAAVMAHELGHYLGLFHVQESDGRADTLLDTRVDDPNLMQASPRANGTMLTESQILVARRHPALAVLNGGDSQSGGR